MNGSSQNRYRHGHTADLVDIVSAWLPRHLKLGDLATIVGCSLRTIQRRLNNARTSCGVLIDEARFNAAAQRARATDESLTAIAMDLCYCDPTCLTRAFRRWTGMPPGELRKVFREHPPARAHGQSSSPGSCRFNA